MRLFVCALVALLARVAPASVSEDSSFEMVNLSGDGDDVNGGAVSKHEAADADDFVDVDREYSDLMKELASGKHVFEPLEMDYDAFMRDILGAEDSELAGKGYTMIMQAAKPAPTSVAAATAEEQVSTSDDDDSEEESSSTDVEAQHTANSAQSNEKHSTVPQSTLAGVEVHSVVDSEEQTSVVDDEEHSSVLDQQEQRSEEDPSESATEDADDREVVEEKLVPSASQVERDGASEEDINDSINATQWPTVNLMESQSSSEEGLEDETVAMGIGAAITAMDLNAGVDEASQEDSASLQENPAAFPSSAFVCEQQEGESVSASQEAELDMAVPLGVPIGTADAIEAVVAPINESVAQEKAAMPVAAKKAEHVAAKDAPKPAAPQPVAKALSKKQRRELQVKKEVEEQLMRLDAALQARAVRYLQTLLMSNIMTGVSAIPRLHVFKMQSRVLFVIVKPETQDLVFRFENKPAKWDTALPSNVICF